MKKLIVIALVMALVMGITGCGQEEATKAGMGNMDKAAAEEPQAPAEPSLGHEGQIAAEKEQESLLSRVRAGEREIIFQLNDSTAAAELYKQLPLSVEAEDFGGTEKIFYPPQALSVEDAPAASGEVGSLAYYKPWDDVVMFYGSIEPGNSLYELGKAVAGGEHIQSLEGTIILERK